MPYRPGPLPRGPRPRRMQTRGKGCAARALHSGDGQDRASPGAACELRRPAPGPARRRSVRVSQSDFRQRRPAWCPARCTPRPLAPRASLHAAREHRDEPAVHARGEPRVAQQLAVQVPTALRPVRAHLHRRALHHLHEAKAPGLHACGAVARARQPRPPARRTARTALLDKCSLTPQGRRRFWLTSATTVSRVAQASSARAPMPGLPGGGGGVGGCRAHPRGGWRRGSAGTAAASSRARA